MNRCRSVVMVALMFGANAALSARAEEAGTSAVDAAWMKAMKANSIDAVVACYASDAVGWFPDMPEAKGEKAIRASYESMLASNTVQNAVLSDTHHKEFGKVSVGWGKFAITVVEKASGKTAVWTGRYSEVAERRGDRWVYVVDHASAEPSPASKQ